MKAFMDHDFLLNTKTAQHLFHDYAENAPLIDYHCHINPREIYEDRRFENLAQVWLGGKQPDGSYAGDHYKWRVMRSNGVSEDYITGDQPDYERYLKFVESLQMAIGNPMYHWCHLELKKFFGYDKPLTPDTAEEVWRHCNDKLQNDPNMTVRGLIRQSNVAFIGTTDDPTDSLEWHKKIAADPSFTVKVCPSFRPDKAINIQKPGYLSYIDQLAHCVQKESLDSVQEVCDALRQRLEFFVSMGCRASDHGLDYIPFRPCTAEEANAIYQKVRAGQTISEGEAEQYQTYLLIYLAHLYHKNDVAMQLHYSCLRNPNESMFPILGPDTGFDVISQNSCGANVAALLSCLYKTHQCPKTVLYSLNPADNAQLGSILGAFQTDELPGKIQHGSAWWFNDTKVGMIDQMVSLANLGLLGNFIGMLTDSRSFLSYARHDYFRRILCNIIGDWVENGEYPPLEENLKRIVEGICYKNALRYFSLEMD